MAALSTTTVAAGSGAPGWPTVAGLAVAVAVCGSLVVWVAGGTTRRAVNMVSSVPASNVRARQLASNGSTIPSRVMEPPSRRASRCLRCARSSR